MQGFFLLMHRNASYSYCEKQDKVYTKHFNRTENTSLAFISMFQSSYN